MIPRLHDPEHRGFASDNYSGVLPEVLEALAIVNGGHQGAYGADVYTERLGAVVREQFGDRAQVYPVANGTGANVVSLAMLADRWTSVVCARSAHINVDECGAPERLAGGHDVMHDGMEGIRRGVEQIGQKFARLLHALARAHADLMPAHARTHATLTPPPPPRRRGRPPKNAAARL